VRISAVALRGFALLCAALGLVPLANLLADGAVPWWNDAVAAWTLQGGLLIAAALVLSLLPGDRLDATLARSREALLRPSPTAFGMSAAVIAAGAAATLAIWSFAGQPFTSDEMAQQFHARILLAGRTAAVPEARPEFFNTAPVIDRGGRWFSQYPVGGPALIALGLLLHADWLVNPVLLGVAVWCLYQCFRRIGPELDARIATVLAVTSPMVLIMAASQMSHVPVLALATLALWSVLRWDLADGGSSALHARAAVTGLALGGVAVLRPLDAVLLATVIGALQVWRAIQEPRRFASLGTQAIMGLVPVLLLLWANDATTGHPLLFGYEALNGPEHGLGFHADPNGDMHTSVRGLVLVSGYLMRLNRYLFEWPLPALLFVIAGALVAPSHRGTLLLTGVAVAFLAGYGAYWFDGFFAGPRFLFTALPAFLFFTAQAVRAMARIRVARLRRAGLLVVPLCIVGTWAGVGGENSALGRARSYREQRTKLKTDVEAQVARAGLTNALVFVNDGWRGRLLARLRVLGLSQFRADRVASTLDACALQTALDEEPAGPGHAERVIARARAYGPARLEPGLPADRAIALVPGTTPTPTCLHEFLRDSAGTMPYAMFLARQRVMADGRVGGSVVFARDLGARNELLRERFGDRAWYVYVPARGLGDERPAFAPYAAPRR